MLFSFRIYERPRDESWQMAINGISVVIPAYNEESYLPDTLRALSVALAKTNLPREIVVVDNASTDRTAAVAEACGARVIHHGTRNISAVRNVGIREARYSLILSIDADCGTPPDAILKILEFMSQGRFIGGGLGLKLLTNKRTVRIVVEMIQFVVERIGGIRGAVFFFLRDEALAIGGFDESKLVAEDSAFAIAMRKRARNQGKKFGLLKEVEITTIDRKNTSLAAVAPLAVKLFRSFLGHKLTSDQLDYWYRPKR